jgi:hypothetical protein
MVSIRPDQWSVNADDPTALTHLLALPGLVVTTVEYAAGRGGVVLHCRLVTRSALCPTCAQSTTRRYQVAHRQEGPTLYPGALGLGPQARADSAARAHASGVDRLFQDLDPRATGGGDGRRGGPGGTVSLDRARLFAECPRHGGSLSHDEELQDRLTEARREVQRGLATPDRAVLKGCRWVLIKNPADRTADEPAQLAAIDTSVPALGQAHAWKEAVRTIFETVREHPTAEARLCEWSAAVEQAGIAALAQFVGTRHNWWEAILNYFPQRGRVGWWKA